MRMLSNSTRVELVVRPRSETAEAPAANAPLAVNELVRAGPLFEARRWMPSCTVLMPRWSIVSVVTVVTGEGVSAARKIVPVTMISSPTVSVVGGRSGLFLRESRRACESEAERNRRSARPQGSREWLFSRLQSLFAM